MTQQKQYSIRQLQTKLKIELEQILSLTGQSSKMPNFSNQRNTQKSQMAEVDRQSSIFDPLCFDSANCNLIKSMTSSQYANLIRKTQYRQQAYRKLSRQFFNNLLSTLRNQNFQMNINGDKNNQLFEKEEEYNFSMNLIQINFSIISIEKIYDQYIMLIARNFYGQIIFISRSRLATSKKKIIKRLTQKISNSSIIIIIDKAINHKNISLKIQLNEINKLKQKHKLIYLEWDGSYSIKTSNIKDNKTTNYIQKYNSFYQYNKKHKSPNQVFQVLLLHFQKKLLIQQLRYFYLASFKKTQVCKYVILLNLYRSQTEKYTTFLSFIINIMSKGKMQLQNFLDGIQIQNFQITFKDVNCGESQSQEIRIQEYLQCSTQKEFNRPLCPQESGELTEQNKLLQIYKQNSSQKIVKAQQNDGQKNNNTNISVIYVKIRQLQENQEKSSQNQSDNLQREYLQNPYKIKNLTQEAQYLFNSFKQFQYFYKDIFSIAISPQQKQVMQTFKISRIEQDQKQLVNIPPIFYQKIPQQTQNKYAGQNQYQFKSHQNLNQQKKQQANPNRLELGTQDLTNSNKKQITINQIIDIEEQSIQKIQQIKIENPMIELEGQDQRCSNKNQQQKLSQSKSNSKQLQNLQNKNSKIKKIKKNTKRSK